MQYLNDEIYNILQSIMEKGLITSKMRSVISLVDKLRDIKLQSYIKLPKIVAVGSQSSGKSSLVEQIVGIDFLPRGSGTVTRRPLEIRMIYQKDLKTPYGVFAEIPNKQISDFNMVKKSIEQLTDKVCGKNKNIIDNPIILDVHSAHCPNLTIIDLPGLTRIAIEGQDKNIHEVTTKMIRKYMEDPNTIILCVIPANQDITNDEVLYMARKIDKLGERTIGCITKIDIMDRGTDARNLLLNKSQVQLKLGFVGIKNRSQADILQNKTVQQSIEDEKMYFSKSPIYSSLPPACIGTTSLVNTLTKVLTSSIVKFLPQLVSKIRQRKNQLSSIIKQYGRPLPKSSSQKQALLWQLCSQFLNQYKKALIGQIGSLRCGDKILKMASRVTEDFNTILEEEYEFNPAEVLSDKHILFALKKYSAGSLPGFPSISSFLYLLDPLLHKLKLPLEHTLTNVFDSLSHIADMIICEIGHQYLGLREHINSKVLSILNKYRKNSDDFIERMIEAEINYIYTNNPHFEKIMNRQTSDKELTDEAKKNPIIIVLRKRVDAYFRIVVKNLRDIIPKNIKYMLVSEATKKIQFQLFQDMNLGGEKIDNLLKIGEGSMKERIRNQQEYDVVCKAESFLLTHSGLASYRQAELKKRIILRERQISQNQKRKKSRDKKKKEKKTEFRDPSPIREEKRVNEVAESSTQKKKQSEPVQKQKEKSMFQNFFGKKDPQKKKESPRQQEKNQTKDSTKQSKKNNSLDEMFGFTTGKKKPEGKQEEKVKKNQQVTDVYNREMGKATDHAVDQLYKNEKFKQKSKQAVTDGASMAAQQQLGVSAQTGNTMGKGVGWLFGQEATQNYLKEQTKKNVREQTQYKNG